MATSDGVQRVEQETVSSQGLANVLHNMNKTRIDAVGNRLSLKDGERLYPKSRSDSTPLGGFAREIAVWLVNVYPNHEAGKGIQRITTGTLRATEAWTVGTLKTTSMLNWTVEGAARSTVLKVPQSGAKSWVLGMASAG